MDQLTYVVSMHNHGLQWLCHSTNFYTKGKSALLPMVNGNCTVHSGFLPECRAREEALRLNGLRA